MSRRERAFNIVFLGWCVGFLGWCVGWLIWLIITGL